MKKDDIEVIIDWNPGSTRTDDEVGSVRDLGRSAPFDAAEGERIDESEKAFSLFIRSRVEPMLRRVARDAKQHGYRSRIVIDGNENKTYGLTAPGIRLFVSRMPMPDQAHIDLSGGISHIAVHGWVRDATVQVCMTTFHEDGTPASNDEPRFRISDWTDELATSLSDHFSNCIART